MEQEHVFIKRGLEYGSLLPHKYGEEIIVDELKDAVQNKALKIAAREAEKQAKAEQEAAELEAEKFRIVRLKEAKRQKAEKDLKELLEFKAIKRDESKRKARERKTARITEERRVAEEQRAAEEKQELINQVAEKELKELLERKAIKREEKRQQRLLKLTLP